MQYETEAKEMGLFDNLSESQAEAVKMIHGFYLNMLQEFLPQFQNSTVLDDIETKIFIDKNYFDFELREAG